MGSLRDIPGDCKKSTKYLRRESVVRLYAGRDYEYASIEIGVCNKACLTENFFVHPIFRMAIDPRVPNSLTNPNLDKIWMGKIKFRFIT